MVEGMLYRRGRCFGQGEVIEVKDVKDKPTRILYYLHESLNK